MAVTLVTTPSTITPVFNGFKMKLNLSDSGSGSLVKQAFWILKDSSGNIIKDEAISRPIGGGDIPLDFKDELKGLVRAKMPLFGVTGVQNDNTVMKEYKLTFGERIIDVSVPGGSITNSSSDSSNYKVLSAANNIMDDSLITDATPRILSYRPKKYNLFPKSYDFMWLLGSGAGSVTYKTYNRAGVLTQTIPSSLTYTVSVIPMNLNTIGASLDTAYMTVDIVDGVLEERYTLDFQSDCAGSQDNAVEIMFIEPLGGRSVALFQTLDSVSADIKFNEVLINKNILTVADLRQDGGSTMLYKETKGVFSMTREMGSDPKEVDWVLGFAASGEYHIRRTDASGAPYWAKFIVTSISYSPGDKTFSASGHLALPVKGTLQP